MPIALVLYLAKHGVDFGIVPRPGERWPGLLGDTTVVVLDMTNAALIIDGPRAPELVALLEEHAVHQYVGAV